MDPAELAARMFALREELAEIFREKKIPQDLATCATLVALAGECLDGPPYTKAQIEWFIGMAASLVCEGKVKTAMIKIHQPKGAKDDGDEPREN